MEYRFDSVDHQFAALDHKIDRVEGVLGTKIDDLGRRTSMLEDDVRAITRHLFNGPEAA